MSFDLVCGTCGAKSGPSVGVCPFCKSVLSPPHGEEDVTLSAVTKLYVAGKLEKALALATALFKEKPELESDANACLVFAKILLETEAPKSRIRALLTKVYIRFPENADVHEYLDLLDATDQLRKGVGDPGETALKNLLRRNPNNVHAMFLLGSHYFWSDKEPDLALHYLQKCVVLRPNMLRAWACLGMVYKSQGHEELAARAFRKCLELETQPEMIAYFKKLLPEAAAA